MATAQDLIYGAMQSLGVMGDGDVPTAAEYADGLTLLNEMLESWTVDRMMVYQILSENFPVTGGVASYTIGPSATFNTARPVNIANAYLRGLNNIDYPLQIIPQESYANIQLKSVQTNIPYSLYYDNAYPQATITLYPVPSIGGTLYINSWKQLQQFASLSDAVTLPPGYKEAIRYSLALRLSPQYGVNPPPQVVSLAATSVARVKRINAPDSLMQNETGYVHARGGRGSFSIYRGY